MPTTAELLYSARSLSPEQRAAIIANPTCALLGRCFFDMNDGSVSVTAWYLAAPRWNDDRKMFGGQRWEADDANVLAKLSESEAEADEVVLAFAVALEAEGLAR